MDHERYDNPGDADPDVITERDHEDEETAEQSQSQDIEAVSPPIASPRPEALSAHVYDIVPTIAAPHSTSINAVALTPDLHWVFTGGSDGYIRKFNWIDTANAKSMLTVAQRHPFVDSVTKAGVLSSYWENSDASSGKPIDDAASISAVYSLAVQHQALWLLSGLESGGINLQSVRHDEGKRIATLRGHTSAVSVLTLAGDQQSFLSGSWDKTVLDWDLNTGKTIRVYEASSGQIAALETRPSSKVPVPELSEDQARTSQGFSSNNDAKIPTNSSDGDGNLSNGEADASIAPDIPNGNVGSPVDSLFGDGQLFGEEEDDFSKAILDGLDDDRHLEISSKDTEGDTLMVNGADAISIEKDRHAEDDKATSPERDFRELPDAKEAKASLDQARTPDHDPAEIPSGSTFLAASFDGSVSIYDKRQKNIVAKMSPYNVPPWATHASWSFDGDFIYVGRRNGSIDEYCMRTGLNRPSRNFKLPNNSGPVNVVRPMPNRRHLICASFDILRLYDLHEQQIFKHASVPFLIIPGHRTSTVSQFITDPSFTYAISLSGHRGWGGDVNEVMLGYEIGCLSE